MGNFKLILKVDGFLEKFNKGEYKISPEIYNIFYGDKNLGELLFQAINEYECYNNSSFSTLSDYKVEILAGWINAAFGKGVIIDNSDIARKLKEAEEDKLKLINEVKNWKELAQKNASDLVYWQGKYDELNKQLKSMFKHNEDFYHE